MHYSGARYLLSFKQKFVALGALKTLQDFTSWEGIPTVQLEPSKKAGEVFAGRAQARDDVIIWAAPRGAPSRPRWLRPSARRSHP